jgi:hypothetical protein
VLAGDQVKVVGPFDLVPTSVAAAVRPGHEMDRDRPVCRHRALQAKQRSTPKRGSESESMEVTRSRACDVLRAPARHARFRGTD